MAVERKPGKNNKFGGVVASAQHRGAAEQIALKAAHQKAVEQPRHQRVLQVQVHPIGIHLLRIAEHHGLQLRFLAPLPQLLAWLPWRPQGIEHITPDRPLRVGGGLGGIPGPER